MLKLNTQGIIVKKEMLESLESPYAFKELILEDIAPFPGYYDHFHIPLDEKEILPKYLFLVVRSFDFFNDDMFLRMTVRIKSAFNFEFDACLGQLYLNNELKSCIRLMLNNYSIIPEIISAFENEGIVFSKNKKVKPYNSVIRIKTFFRLEEIFQGIFKHVLKPEVHYLEIPSFLDWDTFEHITLSLKRNLDNRQFDAALAAAYTRTHMIELVRIYDKDCNLEKLKVIKEKYIQEINEHLSK